MGKCKSCGEEFIRDEDNWLFCENCDSPKTFGFEEALKRIKEGKKVKRAHWGGYWFIKDGVHFDICADKDIGLWQEVYMKPMVIAQLKDNSGLVPATPYQEDLLAEDWSEVE